MPFNEKMHTEFSKLILDKTRGDRLVLDGAEYMQAVYNGELVFNRALYHIEITDLAVRFDAVGGPFTAEVIQEQMDLRCYKTDCDGKSSDVYGFEYAPASLDANESEEELDGTFIVTHIDSGLSVEGTWRQNKDELLRTEYRSVRVIDVVYDMIPASGGTACPILYYSAVRTKVYASGREDQQYVELYADEMTEVGMSSDYTHVTYDSTTGCISAQSLRDTRHGSDFPIAEVYRVVSTDINGEEILWEGSLEVMQGKNTPTYGDWVFLVSSSLPNGDRITSEEQDVLVSVSAWKYRNVIWDSLFEDEDWESTYANLTATVGSLSQSMVYGDAEVRWTVSQNGDTIRTLSVRVYNSEAGYDKTHTVTQDAYVATESWGAPFMNGSVTWRIPASGAAVVFTVPLRQYKYRDGEIIGTYDWDSVATYVEGSSVTANASFSGGRISCDSMGTDYYPSGREVFYATQIKANGKDGVEYDIEIPNSILSIYQDINIEVDRDEDYHISNSVPADGTTIEGEETTIWVYLNATYDVVSTWSSGATARGTYNLPVSISAPDCIPNSTSASGNTSVMLKVRKNESGSSRIISVLLSNSAANYSEEFTFTQKAYVEQEVWMSPQLNGTVSVGEIPADGSGVAISANITQNKTKGGTVIETRTLSISGIGGSAVSGTGVSFADGKISADSMGTTEYKSGRKVYSLTTLKVYGADGVSYDIPLSSAVEIRQAANIKSEAGYGDYKLSVSASPSSGISSMGGTATITASAQIQKLYTWSSGADGGSEYVNSNGNLSVSPAGVATITPTSIMGTNQTATLRISTENTSPKPKVFTVTLEVGGRTATCTVTQNASSYPIEVWKFPSGTICESKKWYLGQVDTGYTRLGGVPVYHIVAATTAAYKDSDAQITAKFSYAYKHSSGDYSGTYNTPVYYKGGTEITINGKVYYGVILVEDLTGLTQGTVDTFSVMGGGDIT